MTYKITTTAPDTKKDELLRSAARRVYEELLRYINSTEERSA